MILTEEQKEVIRLKLNFAVKYKETFDEVYDHVLQTIAGMLATDIYTEKLTEKVVGQEFGGFENLKSIEKQSTNTAFMAMRKKHWENIKFFFNWPTIVFTIGITVAGYLIGTKPGTHKVLFGITFVSSVLPLLFIGYKKVSQKYAAWHTGVYKKPSIKDGYVFSAASLSCNVTTFLSYIVRHFDAYGAITLFVFVCYTIFVACFFRLYSQEYKLNFAHETHTPAN